MSLALFFRVLVGCGVVLIAALWIFGRTKKALPLERGLAFSWLYVRLGLSLLCSALFAGAWLYMVLTLRAPNGRPLDLIDILWITALLFPLTYYVIHFGFHGRVSRTSSFAEDRSAQRSRFKRYDNE